MVFMRDKLIINNKILNDAPESTYLGKRLTVNAVPFGNNFDTGDLENIWVVLVAGSGDWFNYGVQSDVYHAYQLVHSQGIPDDHIIVMHPDDIAYDKHNPTPGVIINALNGTNVYEGVPKDYTGNDVTTKNLFGLLSGDSELVKQGKKVIKSNPKNRIFVYLMSHGETEIFVFPNEILYATDLVNTLGELYKQNKYDQLVLYIESCKSGSMLANKLPNTWNIYAMTASQPDEYAAQYILL
ncbi:unnamed protein product [Oppiella nova]|uniref:Legumain n=1 Tax=Oppiella nova TaxID=334625 RepID=A0A7R9QNW6_9ACAR|nr:unnamed protein product [Oppiella nova]CAG2169592.1 unnamed protein product [Oppiella nova]